MKRFRVVVAGCGGMANVWMAYALEQDDVEIVALVDIHIGAAESMAERYGLACGCFSDISEAIRIANANLVLDITIPASHKTITMTALSSGCDVLSEKPMGVSMEEAREMAACAESSGRMYAVMQNSRYLKNIRALKSLLTGGCIGQPGFIAADFFLGPRNVGFRSLMDSPLIMDMAIHTFDQVRFITGADPVSVYCHEFNPAGSWFKGNAAAVCIFELSDGTVFSYNGSWCAKGVQTSWESDWRITGSLGTAVWDGRNVPYYEIDADAAEQTGSDTVYTRIEAESAWQGKEGHHGCLEEMFAALREGRDAETVCTDNIKSVSMVFAALKSAATGQKIYF